MSDIIEIIGKHVELKRFFKLYLGLCPFHDEKTPSFAVNPKKQTFCCFGCGVNGDTETFVNMMGSK